MASIPELFLDAATAGCTFVCDGTAFGAEDLAVQARRLANGLKGLGIEPGDRIAAWLPNIPQYLSLYAATARLGAILVAVNTRFSAPEIADIVGRSGATMLVAVRAGDNLATLSKISADAMPALRNLILCGDDATSEAMGGPSWPAVKVCAFSTLCTSPPMEACIGGPDDIANIFTTLGTTSLPKFAMHRQSSVVGHAGDVARTLDLRAGSDVSLQLLPFCGIFGFVQVMAAMAAGAKIIMPSAIDITEAVSLCVTERATHLFASDDLIHRMLEHDRADVPFPDLRYCMFAGFNSWLSDLPAHSEARSGPMLAPFGMSEVFALFAARRLDQDEAERQRAGGTLVSAGAAVRARDPESGALLPDGEAGELEVKGPYMFAGYFGDDAATRQAMTDDGYLRTGDLGYSEPDNASTYLQRMSDILRLSGFLVAPAEIETAVVDHPSVRDAQVVAVATPNGNRPVARLWTRLRSSRMSAGGGRNSKHRSESFRFMHSPSPAAPMVLKFSVPNFETWPKRRCGKSPRRRYVETSTNRLAGSWMVTLLPSPG